MGQISIVPIHASERSSLPCCRVDAVLPLEGRSLAEVAAALVGGSSDGHSGSALYLLSSILNHSCTPSVDVQFADNSSRRAITQLRVNTVRPTSSWCTSCRMFWHTLQ